MEGIVISCSQIKCAAASKSWDHRSSVKPGFSTGDYLSIANANGKIMRRNAFSLCLQSSFKAPLFIATSPGRANNWVHLVKATSSGNTGGEDAGTKSHASNNNDDNIFGIFGCLFKIALDILSKKKDEYKNIEKKIENALDVAEEVADTVEEVAKFTEEIAERVEKESPKHGMVFQAAEMVDKFSETLARDAQFVENEAEMVEKAIKAIDGVADRAEDALDSIAEQNLSTVTKKLENSVSTENSRRQSVKTKNN